MDLFDEQPIEIALREELPTGAKDAHNLAEYLHMRPVSAIHVRVPHDVVFVGFSGGGNMNAQLTQAQAHVRSP